MTLSNLKKILMVAVLYTSALSLSAQNKIRYSYDAAGNRIKREIVIEPQKAPENSQKSTERSQRQRFWRQIHGRHTH